MKDKRNNLKLTTKMHTGFGITSFCLGMLSIILFSVAVTTSAFEDRILLSVQYKIGIIEIIAMILSLVGIAYGFVGESKKDRFKLFAHLGIGTNIIALIFHILVIIFAF